MPTEKQMDVLLRLDDLFTVGTGNFIHDGSILATHGDANLGAGIAAEHWPVLDKRYVQAQSCRRECR